MEWQTLVIEPAPDAPACARRCQYRRWSIGVLAALATLLPGGCVASGNRLVFYGDVDVLFTTPADVDRLCKLAPHARQDGRYLGCYFPVLRLVIVPHNNAAVLAHELRHARDGQFHE